MYIKHIHIGYFSTAMKDEIFHENCRGKCAYMFMKCHENVKS